jgi:shikimate dehydrogenase
MEEITTRTKLVAILGSPVSHTLSPAMHNAAFRDLGLDYYYLPIEVSSENLGAVVGGLRWLNYAGFNVTMPHKVGIIKYLDEIDGLAELVGAVNTVVIRDGRLKGYNTDGTGFIHALEQEKGIAVRDKKILILGAGGAAKSIALALAASNVREIAICNRTPDKAVELAAHINRQLRPCSRFLQLEPDSAAASLAEMDIIINTTSIGMAPDLEGLPLDTRLLNPRQLVCDIVYHPLQTRFLREAENIGCPTMNGLGMLIYQGAEAFSLWTGQPAPVAVMRAAIT